VGGGRGRGGRGEVGGGGGDFLGINGFKGLPSGSGSSDDSRKYDNKKELRSTPAVSYLSSVVLQTR